MTTQQAREHIRLCHEGMALASSPFIRAAWARQAQRIRALLPILED